MSCNYPMLAEYGQILSSGKREVKILGRYDRLVADDHPGSFKVPCGKCLGCRADYCRTWADRMVLELDHSKKAVFVTLTYDDDHLPVLYQITTGQSELTLKKRDLQLFFKRLRKRFRDREIRYYAAGEYGTKTNRPHYHAIIYGISLSDFEDLSPRGNNQLGQFYYSSERLARDIWKNGFCLLADVSWKTCAYVARYVNKKQYGLVSDEFIDRMQEPVFSVSSRNPGIGMYYIIEHPEFADFVRYSAKDTNGSLSIYFPRTFLDRLELIDPDRAKEIKESRKLYANNNELLKLKNTDLTSTEIDEISENQISLTKNIIDSYRISI